MACHAHVARSFVFELPLSWTTTGPLNLSALVNSSGGIAEDSLDDNTSNAGPFTFSPDPGLRVGYINMSYLYTDGVLRATLPVDEDSSQSWLRRLYPIASSTTVAEQQIRGDALASCVARTDRDCLRFLIVDADDRNQCAVPQVSDALLTRGFSTGDRICMGPGGVGSRDIFLNYAWDNSATQKPRLRLLLCPLDPRAVTMSWPSSLTPDERDPFKVGTGEERAAIRAAWEIEHAPSEVR